MPSRRWFVLGLALAAGALLLLASSGFSAIEAKQTPTWTVWASGGDKFSGVYTNNTGQVVNAVAVGTAAKSQDSVTSFDFGGTRTPAANSCQLYADSGSAFCYVNVATGQHVAFSGATAQPFTAGTDLQACDSIDDFQDSNCTDNAAQSGNPAAVTYLYPALNAEKKALPLVKTRHFSTARELLDKSRSWLRNALSNPATSVALTPSSTRDIHDAINDDDDALNALQEKNVRRAAALIGNAIRAKKDALLAL